MCTNIDVQISAVRAGFTCALPARNASQRESPILRKSGVHIFPNPGTRRPDFGNRKPELGSGRVPARQAYQRDGTNASPTTSDIVLDMHWAAPPLGGS